MEITPVENHQIDFLWSRVKPYFEQVAETTHGRFTANDIRQRVKTTKQQLWIAHEGEEVYGFVITQCTDYPQMRCLVMHFTAGRELFKWKDAMLKTIQEFARNNGCEAIESFGRAGWAKVFKEDGYKAMQTFYELPVGTV